MAPILFEETNVFKFAHSRMKKLMNCCTSKVDLTDFTSSDDFENLLQRLEKVLFELIAHEQIENQLVMKKLRTKLSENSSLKNKDLVCNCHKDDRFTPLLNLFRDGYSFIRRDNADRISYQMKLHKSIRQFYEEFLPHMVEEENDIQPLLIEYFTEIELKIMRVEVIRMTLKKRENCSFKVQCPIERPIQLIVGRASPTFDRLSDEIVEKIIEFMSIEQIKRSCLSINQQWNQCSNRVLEHRSSISRIPNEVLLKLFRFYLSPFDLLRSCLTVNRRWFNLVRNKSLWTRVNPIDWSRDQCSNKNPAELSFASNDVQLETMKQRQANILSGFQNNFLPTYGHHIEELNLYGSLTLTDNQARILFSLCPNIKRLNLGRTSISSKSFIHYRWTKNLESLILEDCHSIDDQLFVNLAWKHERQFDAIEEDKHKSICLQTLQPNESLDDRCLRCRSRCFENEREPSRLKHLNLWNCYRLTDRSISILIDSGLHENIESIDLSGCPSIRIETIERLVDLASKLNSEESFFCQNANRSRKLSQMNSCRNIDLSWSNIRFCSC